VAAASQGEDQASYFRLALARKDLRQFDEAERGASPQCRRDGRGSVRRVIGSGLGDEDFGAIVRSCG
jgi:hypothetical protein